MRLAALAIAVGAAAGTAASDIATFRLPEELARYREWSSPTTEPVAVPHRMWIQCMRPEPEQRAQEMRLHGPHSERLIRVYTNPPAKAELGRAAPRSFPLGSVIAKDKLGAMSSSDVPHAVAFMVKRGGEGFRDAGGWEFLLYPQEGDARSLHEACAACHRGAQGGDYVFGIERQD
jgi:Cytochrome P460